MSIVLALYKFLIIIIIIIIFYRGHPRFRNFYSTIPVDIVRVKSKKELPLWPCACSNKGQDQYTLLRSRVACVRCCDHALERRKSRYESDVSIVLLNSVLHGPFRLSHYFFSLVSSTIYAASVSFDARLFHLLFFLKKTWRFYL